MSRPTISASPPGTGSEHADGEARGAAALAAAAHVAEDAAAAAPLELRRHPVEIAGDLAARGIDQQIEAGARLRRQRWRDDGGEPLGAAGLELLAQAGDLGLQRLDAPCWSGGRWRARR